MRYITAGGEVGVHFPGLEKTLRMDPAGLKKVTLSLTFFFFFAASKL